MNIADRIQHLRKSKGISQEELAEQIGVSRQAVSKWESRQSLPDIEKCILLSDYFDVTTDYLLKGTEPETDIPDKKPDADARIFATVGSVLNFIGLVVSVVIWIEKQTAVSVAVGLIIMAIGCMIFAIGQFTGENKKESFVSFWIINVWLLSLIPVSCIFNCIDVVLGGFGWMLSPFPQLGNSFVSYGLCWAIYVTFCVLTDFALFKVSNDKKAGITK